MTDRKGAVTSFSYDQLNRLTFVGYNTTGPINNPSYDSTIDYTYDAADRLTHVADSMAGAVDYGYDGFDNPTSEQAQNGTVSSTYDSAGRRQTMTVAGQSQISYSYNPSDQLTGISRGSLSASFQYDDAGRLTALTLPDGISQQYTYDNADRPIQITHQSGNTTIGDLRYAYTPGGLVSGVGGAFARVTLPSAVVAASYDAANEVASWGGTSYTYDANGALTSDGVRTLTWDSRHQLSTVTMAGVSAAYSYDAFGRRFAKTVNQNTTEYLYDGTTAIQEQTANGTPTVNLLTGPGIDDYLSRTDSSGTQSFLTDPLGTTIALADASGTIQASYTYDPFGNPTASGPTSANTHEFTGRDADETGLTYYRARYMDPGSGRFISQDPLGFAGGANVYAYALDDPTNVVDPSGLFSVRGGNGWPPFPGRVYIGRGGGGPVTAPVPVPVCGVPIPDHPDTAAHCRPNAVVAFRRRRWRSRGTSGFRRRRQSLQ